MDPAMESNLDIGSIRTGGGISMKCSSPSTANSCTSGVPWTAKARFWISSFNHGETARRHWSETRTLRSGHQLRGLATQLCAERQKSRKSLNNGSQQRSECGSGRNLGEHRRNADAGRKPSRPLGRVTCPGLGKRAAGQHVVLRCDQPAAQEPCRLHCHADTPA